VIWGVGFAGGLTGLPPAQDGERAIALVAVTRHEANFRTGDLRKPAVAAQLPHSRYGSSKARNSSTA